MSLNSYLLKNKKKNNQNFVKIKTSFDFVSLINSKTLTGLTDLKTKNDNKKDYNNPNQKIFIKNSYLIIAWFYYFSNYQADGKFLKKKKVNFFFSKNSRFKFTQTKAPIAHKNWSKEQFKFNFFNFKIGMSYLMPITSIKQKGMLVSEITTMDLILLFFLLIKKSYSFPETNLLTLKNAKQFFVFSDLIFFNYI